MATENLAMCILENYDPPENCVISQYYDFIFDLEQKKQLPIRTIVIRGKEYRYLTVKDVMNAHQYQKYPKQQKQEVIECCPVIPA